MDYSHILKSHNKSLLLYHYVCPTKYRRDVFDESVALTLKEVCVGISEGYEINLIEIGSDEDHVHFSVQSEPISSPKSIIQRIKSITAKRIFKTHLEVKKKLWGGKFWTSGYYVKTVGQYGNGEVIKAYVKNEGKEYKEIHLGQLELL